MKRRELITLLGGAAAWPLAARAQQPALPVIGYLASGTVESNAVYDSNFRQGLGEAGYGVGRDVSIEYRWAEGEINRLPELAADLVRRRAAVIVATPLPAALAAKAATSTIPVVFNSGEDPVKAGLVTSLNRPGGNLTGVSSFTTVLAPKRLELLRELLPRPALIAMLVNTANPTADSEISDMQEAARTVGQQILFVHANNDSEIDEAFSTIGRAHADALIVGAGPLLNSRRTSLAALAARHRLPAIYPYDVFAKAGGLMSYGSALSDSYRQVASYVVRILKGAKPADLPVQQPTKFELVINLKTAKALGLTVPPGLLVAADEVIE
jgi:putative ABC transport system substrate-binding protein